MKIVEATYDDNEQGWVSQPIELTGDISLEVELSEEGYVVVKQLDEDANIFRNVLVSSYCSKVKGNVYGDAEGQTILVTSSVEPKLIQYGNI